VFPIIVPRIGIGIITSPSIKINKTKILAVNDDQYFCYMNYPIHF